MMWSIFFFALFVVLSRVTSKLNKLNLKSVVFLGVRECKAIMHYASLLLIL